MVLGAAAAKAELSTRATLIAAAVALSACGVLFGCGDDDAPASARDATTPMDRNDAGDAAVIPPPEMDSGEPNFPGLGMDGSFPLPLDDAAVPVCALKVAAECDGAEDCGSGVCCATFDPFSVSYSAIRCQDTCEALNELVLCHADQPCTADRSVECHQSLLIGQPFIGVCVRKEQAEPPPVGRGVAGEIACGGDSCIVGSEHCCLRTSFSFSTLQSTPLDPYCAALDTPCDCADDIVDDLDAGSLPGSSQDDAGR